MVETTYQVDPLFQVGQLVPHEAPVTVPLTVSVLDAASVALTDALVVGPVLTLTPEHAGAMASVAAEIGATAIRTSMTAVRAAVAQRLRCARMVVVGVVGWFVSIGWAMVA